ncbi:MAG: hypothetical protein L3J23_07455 [Flavobacteriaceae bacterium]|nr:hypothetical protein [Flavobacteriaceae bacterium]
MIILTILGSNSCKAQKKNPSEFLPEGYVIFEKIYGDLNKDGLEDCVIIIKKTEKKDNRRGIIVIFNKNDNYELAAKNDNCFSSENENGGVYFPPELSINIKKGNLYIQYSHGRYGYWKYTFKFQDPYFKLIGYDSSDNYGSIVNKKISINFLTKKKLIKENTNEKAKGGDEIFKETREKITINKPIKLSEIERFDKLNILETCTKNKKTKF